MQKLCSFLLALLFIFTLAVPAFAAGNVQYITGVTEQMTNPAYWANKQNDADVILMKPSQIAAYNKMVAQTPNTYRVDLYAEKRAYDANELKNELLADINANKPDRELYIRGTKLNNDSYFDSLAAAFQATGWTGSRQFQYAICTTHTAIYAIPTDDVIGYSSTDPDSEFQLSELRVNEPFLVKQYCEYNGKVFYWGMSSHLSGWVNAAHIGICADRDSWKDAFEVNPAGKDFLVVTTDKTYTEPSLTVPQTANVKLVIGTMLKLIPPSEMPAAFGERFAYNNYAVYLPTRTADGQYEKVPALISQHCDVSVGYLPMTQRNLLKVAFSCLGNRYGWAGMLDSMDCSLFTRAVYLCCGLNMPRNTTWQQNVPETRFSLENKTEVQKLAFLKNLPAGSLLYFPGHTMVFVGMENNMGYVISDTGSLSNPDGALDVKSAYSVILNPLSARRRDGSTWLQNLVSAVVPAEYNSHRLKNTFIKATPQKAGLVQSICLICGQRMKDTTLASPAKIKLSSDKYAYTGKAVTPKVKVVDTNGKKISADNYTVKYKNNKNIGTATVTVKFKGSYSGSMQTTFTIVPKGTLIKSVQVSGNKLIVTWKKQDVKTSGYQIQLANNSAFTKNKRTVTIKDPAQTMRTIKNLKKGTYFLRIRTLNKDTGKVLSSPWSATTSIRIAS